MNRVIGANQKFGAGSGEFVPGLNHEGRNAVPIFTTKTCQVVFKRMRMHRHLRVPMGTEYLGSGRANCAITQCGPSAEQATIPICFGVVTWAAPSVSR